jgi:hypothetical protein
MSGRFVPLYGGIRSIDPATRRFHEVDASRRRQIAKVVMSRRSGGQPTETQLSE